MYSTLADLSNQFYSYLTFAAVAASARSWQSLWRK